MISDREMQMTAMTLSPPCINLQLEHQNQCFTQHINQWDTRRETIHWYLTHKKTTAKASNSRPQVANNTGAPPKEGEL